MANQHKKDEGFNLDEQQAGFMMGAVMGALVGGAAALLLSPKNGKEMRAIVKKYSKELELEAHELAKDARGTATSFKSILEEGATEVIEQAPEKIEQAGYQAQQLADELSLRFESARDVVAELADAFKSGWEEYGENEPEDELQAAPSLLDDEELPKEASLETREVAVETVQARVKEPEIEDEDEDEVEAPVVSLQARRRTHHGSSHYSMHSTPATDEPEAQATTPVRHETREVEDHEPKKSEASSYTTRVLDEPKKVEPVKPRAKAEDAPAKKPDEAKKKLLFRRTK